MCKRGFTPVCHGSATVLSRFIPAYRKRTEGSQGELIGGSRPCARESVRQGIRAAVNSFTNGYS